MLWAVMGKESHQIISCNTHIREKGGDTVYQLWVERPNGKTMLVFSSPDEKEVQERKDMIDFAIESGEKTVNLV